jgi:hypothetical protein
MRVDWAIPCRYAEVAPQGGATIVGAGADVVIVPEVPATIPVLFAVRFVGAPEELDGETPHDIVCRIFTPAGHPLGEQRARIENAEVTQLVPGFVADITLPMGVVVHATEAGSYPIEFQIDDDHVRVPLHVVLQPPVD